MVAILVSVSYKLSTRCQLCTKSEAAACSQNLIMRNAYFHRYIHCSQEVRGSCGGVSTALAMTFESDVGSCGAWGTMYIYICICLRGGISTDM